ncbi:MBL fold metallo-hydrolase [Paeniroseomonas aquatica]|uniref:MBL fold metallo-hydrolase n=1 Tax=Paeniroseomonas aquatica TaxID=373043 RepID=A0ABT8A9G5_9PROT|nr:MBL fold metallo-hydrolase [Paeniroseomonas aquatica]MDN3566412.1 MBL fold metallo-hydrolase [Paeniroseomonas aquatica]
MAGLTLLAAAGPWDGPGDKVRVAPGIFVLPGVQADTSAANLDAIANTGFIARTRAVAVIDPGGSHARGMRLQQAIAATTPLPVRHLILTHVHPDHAMGAAAFADLQPEVIGHVRLTEALARRDAFYRAMLMREMGEAAAGSAPLAPARLVEDRLSLDLGGRVPEVVAQPPAHTDHDLLLFDQATGTPWLSDLLFVARIPVLDAAAMRRALRKFGLRLVADRPWTFEPGARRTSRAGAP